MQASEGHIVVEIGTGLKAEQRPDSPTKIVARQDEGRPRAIQMRSRATEGKLPHPHTVAREASKPELVVTLDTQN